MSEVNLQVAESRVAAEDMPRVVGWRILVEPVEVRTVTAGGILLSGEAIRAEEHLRYAGRVLAMGDLCYKHAKFEGCEPWCKVGDFISYGQYTGQPIQIRDRTDERKFVELRILNDDEVRAVIPNPDALLFYAV